VGATAIGGHGGWGIDSSGQAAGDGASVELVNAVDGDTSGSLSLTQLAQGGRAGEFGGGVHGFTSSRLDVSKSSQALEATSFADGAFDAQSRVSARNSGGGVVVHNEAYGGAGRNGGHEPAERGGDVRARAFARSVGDGHAVVVAPTDSRRYSARGGDGGWAFLPQIGSAGRGGNAISTSKGVALGDSAVTVEDRAAGGRGGLGSALGGAPGLGGSAFSSAIGISKGASPVHVSAHAIGGSGGWFDLFSGGPGTRGGAARAESKAFGSGEVVSLATAIGGLPGLSVGFPGPPSGSASARASARGASGEARADAHASGLELSNLSAKASASVHSRARVESKSSVLDPFVRNPLGAFDAFAIAAGRPEPPDVQEATQGSAQVADAFDEGSIDIVLSLGQVGFTKLQGEADCDATTQHAALSMIPNALEVSALQDVMVGFMNPEFSGSGFDSLRFRANIRNETMLDVTFDEIDEAVAYFDDRILDLGGFDVGCTDGGGFGRPDFCFVSPLELLFDWTGSKQDSGFGVDLIVGVTPVPEPSTALLLAVGVAVLAARARRRRAAI
jgi:hypothetical protein